jgi:hypothetical protein
MRIERDPLISLGFAGANCGFNHLCQIGGPRSVQLLWSFRFEP